MQEFEYVVVGGGSSGMALAARLSKANKKTLLLEAGPVKSSRFNFWKVAMPAAYGYAFMNWAINSMYEGEAEPTLNNRRLYQPRGKILGGSSSINGMGFIRPHPALFDEWVKQGADGWSFEDVLPYFKRLETWTGAPSLLRGTDGPVHIIKGDFDCPYYDAFIEAGRQAGFNYTADNNAEMQEGFGHFQMNIEKGVRASTAYSYKKHVADDQWLTIVGHAHVSRLVLEKEKAKGVEYLRSGQKHRMSASKEIILSGGAFNTPQLLMLSGIGPENEPKAHDIPAIQVMPGVAENLQDHPILYPKYLSKNADTPIKYQRLDLKAIVGAQWLLNQKGPGASNYMEAIAFLRSEPSVPIPDIEFQFCPLVIDHAEGGAKNNIHDYILQHLAGDYHPVGTCKIGSQNDTMAVVDPHLRVYGIANLRIADASVMPVIPNANTSSTSIMIGERAADLLLNDSH